MDSDSDYLLYATRGEKSEDEEERTLSEPCSLCSNYQGATLVCDSTHATHYIPFDRACTGRMAPYVELIEEAHAPQSTTLARSETTLHYVRQGDIASLRGTIHMQDVPPHGTWLCEKSECSKAVERLRLAGLTCVLTPELNRVVLEQKNDDGLLHLANEWLWDKENMSQGIELFGPFVCDAMLAPVLHRILRSDWIDDRKELGETNNELKLGWAQEFYDWRLLAKNGSGSALFPRDPRCPKEPDVAHSGDVARRISDKMRWCGCTPWSAVQALRCSEAGVTGTTCPACKSSLLASCAFLMECAAVEASRQRDWLVRNEAVIQLCWVLCQIHWPVQREDHDLLRGWAESIAIHSIRFREYEAKGGEVLSDPEALVVLFANDHLPAAASVSPQIGHRDETPVLPDADLMEALTLNERFSAKPVVRPTTGRDEFNIFTAVDVFTRAPADTAEARAQDVDATARAIVSCFPRVAASALGDLTLRPPDTREFSGRIWPVFVNATRACYRLFKSLALPVSPSPVYTLELLARSWRRVPSQVIERFVPMSTGGVVKVSREHYARHLEGPLSALVTSGVMSERERDGTILVLSTGVLPCFAGEGDSVPDRLVSTTMALAFAACGIRVLGSPELDEDDGGQRTVTSAGLLYFAAWYVLVYAGAVHTQPTVKTKLYRSGSDADKHLCEALNRDGSDSYLLDDREIVEALRIVFGGGLLDTGTILRVAELYVPELLAQLPYATKLKSTPGSVKRAIESRDAWFVEEHGPGPSRERFEIPFAYLGNIAHGVHSSIEGTVTAGDARPIARALHRPDEDGTFDPWCDTLWVHERDGGPGIEDALRQSFQQEEGVEVFYALDSPETSDAVGEQPRVTTYEEDSPTDNLEDKSRGRRICKGLHVENVDKLGFGQGRRFLTMLSTTAPKVEEQDRWTRVANPGVRRPCMANIASTVYTKTQRAKSADASGCHRCTTLIEALWVLFKHAGSVAAEAASATAAGPAEPSTPEALAVMVHLAVKSLDLESDVVSLCGVCNDMTAMCQRCDRETEFVPITAIAGGLFGLNVELNVEGFEYHIVNEHYRERWACGALCYNGGCWYVRGVHPPVRITREKSTSDCYHTGTLGAYFRLNDLKIRKVPSDNYCGFHTVSALLTGTVGRCETEDRQRIARKTAQYVTRNKARDEIGVYLRDTCCKTSEDLTSLLMLENRWLSVDEVNFMLRAHEIRPSAMITEHSYPIYEEDCAYFLFKNNHFEPVARQT